MKQLLMTAAGAALLGLGTTVALAEEGMNYTGAVNGHNVVGSVMLHDVWSDVDVGTFDDDTNTIGGEFAIAHSFGNMWRGQVDASFNSIQFDSGPVDSSTDVMRIGVGAYHEGANNRLGFSLGYDSFDSSTRDDGWDVGVGGEFFISNQMTLGAGVSYVDISGVSVDGTGWGVDAKGTFYTSDRLSLGLRLSYLDFDFDGVSGDAEVFGIGGELEYLCPDSPLSLLAAIRYHDIDFSVADGDITSVEVGLKWRFNTEGSLVDQDRSSTFDMGGAAATFSSLAF